MTRSTTTPTSTTSQAQHHAPYQRQEPAVVTQEQLDRCTRYLDENTGQIFYRVTSESDPAKEYTVRALRRHGKYYTTCTCPAGQEGTSCKHVRWAKAHAREYWKLREAATEILDRTERRGGKVEYTVRDETGYNLVRLGRTPPGGSLLLPGVHPHGDALPPLTDGSTCRTPVPHRTGTLSQRDGLGVLHAFTLIAIWSTQGECEMAPVVFDYTNV